MIFQQNDITRQILLKFLTEGICQVAFSKMKDNSNRFLLCTLNPKDIPSKYSSSITKIIDPSANLTNPPIDEDLLAVWDISDGKWKSFRISRAFVFKTEDELLQHGKNDEKLTSKQKQIIEQRKRKKLLEEKRKNKKKSFQDKVEELKEQAKESRDNLLKAKDIINKIRNEAQQRRDIS